MQCNKPIDPNDSDALVVYAWIEGVSADALGLLHSACVGAYVGVDADT